MRSSERRVAQSLSLDVVIVAYRCRELLRACLESLAAHPPTCPLYVCVVDNASADGTKEMVLHDFPHVDLIAWETNRGFAAGTNAGIRQGSSPYVLALNPDTRMRPQTLDRLLEIMEVQPEVGIAGCRLELEDGTFDHASRRSFPTPLGALAHFTGIGRHVKSGPLAQYRATQVDNGPVDAVNGAFMLMRRSALEEVGLYDEGYWMYMEDLDLCYRFAQAGWTTWYEPGVKTLHVKGATWPRARSVRLTIAFHYGMYRFYRKHYAGRRAVDAAIVAGIGVKLAAALARVAATAARRPRHRWARS
jgi:N-acetylglucosaminyl-diphospho-decaprenol L-rhamnosyltransferase